MRDDYELALMGAVADAGDAQLLGSYYPPTWRRLRIARALIAQSAIVTELCAELAIVKEELREERENNGQFGVGS